MSAPDSQQPHRRRIKIRRDGWTAERQIGFLACLSETNSVAAAAASVGMSRKSAYRLRSRAGGALFAALWARLLAPDARAVLEGHILALDDRHLARLLGTHLRRKRGDFSAIGSRPTGSP